MSVSPGSETSLPFSLNFLTDVAITFKLEPFIQEVLNAMSLGAGTIEFNFVDDATISQLNQTYLNHEGPTDIITFNLGDDVTLMGDIYIGVGQAARNAAEFKGTLDDEIKLLIVHGILHLMGFEDNTKAKKAEMDREQNRILEKIHGQSAKR